MFVRLIPNLKYFRIEPAAIRSRPRWTGYPFHHRSDECNSDLRNGHRRLGKLKSNILGHL
jgi:hypothetical protein